MTGLREQIQCVQREISLRKRVYPQLVERTRMTQAKAAEEIACMEDVLLTLRECHDRERLA